LLGKAINIVERISFKGCQRLIFLSNEMMNNAVSEYSLDVEKCHVSYPFVTIENFKDRGALVDVFDSSKVNVVYSGALGEKQNIEGLIAFLNLCVSESVHVHIFSQGPKFDELKQVSTVDDSRFFFHDLVNEIDLPELLIRSDVQILPQAAGTSKGSLPSKLPNIIASKSKLLAITDSGSELSMLLEGVEGVKVSTTWEMDLLVSDLLSLIREKRHTGKHRLALINLLNIETVLKEIG